MGRYSHRTVGILVTIAVFIQLTVKFLLFKSFGVMLVAVRRDLDNDTWVVGVVFELVECIDDLLAPTAGALGKVLGYRPAVMIGGAMSSLGFIVASRASNVLQLALPLNLITGIGFMLPHILLRARLAQHFDNRQYFLASGISKLGVSVSMLLAPPLLQLFLDTYGWRGAMLLTGSLVAFLVVCGALLVPAPPCPQDDEGDGYQPPSDDRSQQSDGQAGDAMTSLKSHCLDVWKAFDTSVLREYNFWVLNAICVAARLSKSAWIMYFIPHVIEKGFTGNVAALVATLAGLGSLVATVLASVALFKGTVSSSRAMGVAVVFVAVPLLVDPWVDSLWLLSINAALFMGGIGALNTMIDVMLKEDLGGPRMASALGWLGPFSIPARLLAGFIPGWIYDHSGSYDAAFLVLGSIQVASVVPLLIRKSLKKET